MDEQKRLEAIQELERQIAELPIGYISKKNINGKTRYYHQWTENGKKRSKYLRDGEMEPLQEQIEQRKSLQAELKKLQAGMPKQRQPKLDFETSVIIGRGLARLFRRCPALFPGTADGDFGRCLRRGSGADSPGSCG